MRTFQGRLVDFRITSIYINIVLEYDMSLLIYFYDMRPGLSRPIFGGHVPWRHPVWSGDDVSGSDIIRSGGP